MHLLYQNLADTKDAMCSGDYKLRFIAEHAQLLIRMEKLHVMLEKAKNGKLDFIPTCPISLLEVQYNAMKTYYGVLQARMVIENINITDYLKTNNESDDSTTC